ncbi:hypothetical protein E2C01_000253 [Portunus trituberculatus]|uniref:Uncharacterized protein n=1 Tax=Portunus trituberculatus TaxID=210409 RepID=A0A5B7CEN4_PORTR|nr:hypothetical protein [Portunus trituberculatus]
MFDTPPREYAFGQGVEGGGGMRVGRELVVVVVVVVVVMRPGGEGQPSINHVTDMFVDNIHCPS